MSNDPLVKSFYESLHEWEEREKANNPSFRLFYGRKSFSIDQIVEHIEKDTDEGKVLKKMIFKAAIDIFSNKR